MLLLAAIGAAGGVVVAAAVAPAVTALVALGAGAEVPEPPLVLTVSLLPLAGLLAVFLVAAAGCVVAATRHGAADPRERA